MGTEEQKLSLAGDLIGLNKNQVKQFFDTCTAEISGLYLIELGQVSTLRKTFNIPDSFDDKMNVYKFGRSNNIAKRFQQHVRSYAKLKIYNIKLMYYCPIDSETVSKAESELADHFEIYDMKLDNPEHTEIAIFEPNGKKVKGVFEQLFKIHMTTNIALITKLKEARSEITNLQDKLNIIEKQSISEKESYENLSTMLQEKCRMLEDKCTMLKEANKSEIKSIQELNALKIKSLQAKIKRRDKKLARYVS